MPEFSLPHDHGAHGHTEDLYRELKNVEHFGAASVIASAKEAMQHE